MRLIETAVVLLIITFSLSFCLKGSNEALKQHEGAKCLSEGHQKGSDEYKNCKKEGAKPIYKRAIEMQNQAREIKDLMNKNQDIMSKGLYKND